MKRLLLTVAAIAGLAFAAPAPRAEAATSIDVAVHIGDPYRGAALRFRSEPDVVLVPRSRVYYVRDYDHDLYRYGRYWYFVEDGRWYRARSYRGPFIHIRVASVPYEVYNVPTRYRRRWHGPPAHAPAHGYYKNKNRDRDRGWDRDDRDWDRDRDRDRRDRDDRDRDRNRDRDGGGWYKGN